MAMRAAAPFRHAAGIWGRIRAVQSFFIGAPVRTSDETEVGHVEGFVVRPGDRTVTHMLVQTGRAEWTARLVPIEKARRVKEVVVLADDAATYNGYELIEGTTVLDADDPRRLALSLAEVMPNPYSSPLEPVTVSYDRLPPDEIELRAGSEVEGEGHAVLGHLIEIEIDGENRVTRIGIERGLLRHHYAFAPEPAIASLHNERVVLRWTRDEARAEEQRIADEP